MLMDFSNNLNKQIRITNLEVLNRMSPKV